MKRRISILGFLVIGAIAVAAVALTLVSTRQQGNDALKTSLSSDTDQQVSGSDQHESLKGPHFMKLDRDAFQTSLGKVSNGGEPVSSDGPAQEAYDNQAYPAASIAAAQQLAAANAAKAIGKLPGGKKTNWQEVGPSGVPASALVASESTGATAGTIYSGRATAIAISPDCHANDCKIFIGAAGGGVWEADNALASQLNWHPSGNGIPSNAIGSIVFDPNDPKGKTLYVGTGEPNGSGDSEAGVGLYKSTDFGQSWTLVAGSTASTAPCNPPSVGTCPVATGRSIGAIAIDPADPNHIFIGTDVARHGSSSSNGGRFTPPGSAKVGLYESTDGGATFSPALILTQDTVAVGSATGGDFFRAGASDIELYRASGETQVYASFFAYGVYRRSNTLDGDTAFHQIFNSAGGGSIAQSSFARTEFSLAPNGSSLRIYVGDSSSAPARFYRVDNANVTAATLFTGGTNGGWTQLSNSTNGTPGFGSYNYCTGQCSYDMPVYSPPGAPDIVYIGGAMQYGELGSPHRSNGRAVQRSENAGVDFTDMTIDTHGVSLHPDQHAIATTPLNPDIVFIANDGGLWRLDGSFSIASGQCSLRSLSGANLTDCTNWLSKVPTTISSLNRGLGTLQYQSLSVNVQDPLNDIMGGTQDNGTHAFNSKSNGNGNGNSNWFVTIFGDGGQSGINVFNPNIRFHTFFDAQVDVNFSGTAELGWDWISDPFFIPPGSSEPRSFYIPIIVDPTVNGTMFTGLRYVWRTPDNGGPQSYLDTVCSEFFGTFATTCGDWVQIGTVAAGRGLGDGTFWGLDKQISGYIVAIERASSDNDTLWVGTRRGRLFISKNVSTAAASVVFTRTDTSATPSRFVSGIAVDPSDPNTAYVSFSGYNAYDPVAGHVFKVHYNGGSPATWTDLSYNLGDQPITDVALDSMTGDLFVSSDFGVDMLKSGSTQWAPAAGSLPPVATYGLTIDSNGRVLYAATHGRGAWKLDLK